mmetsp:Transcript_6799/g.23725  ORF Transcript_6799/g.23725 Transcript_6799/m.23725 type:complete len:447 (+) Transcript_6799:267-1607(+)
MSTTREDRPVEGTKDTLYHRPVLDENTSRPCVWEASTAAAPHGSAKRKERESPSPTPLSAKSHPANTGPGYASAAAAAASRAPTSRLSRGWISPTGLRVGSSSSRSMDTAIKTRGMVGLGTTPHPPVCAHRTRATEFEDFGEQSWHHPDSCTKPNGKSSAVVPGVCDHLDRQSAIIAGNMHAYPLPWEATPGLAALDSPWYHTAPSMVMSRRGATIAFQREDGLELGPPGDPSALPGARIPGDGVKSALSKATAAGERPNLPPSAAGLGSLSAHCPRASGLDQASTFVPPQEVATSPSGVPVFLWSSRPKNQQVAEKYVQGLPVTTASGAAACHVCLRRLTSVRGLSSASTRARETIRIRGYCELSAAAAAGSLVADTVISMLLWPEHTHTSPNRTSLKAMVVLKPAEEATMVCGSEEAGVGGRSTFHFPSAPALAGLSFTSASST